MALEARLLQKLNQSLLMTPQLQQAIKLLQLGRLEYLEAIEKELLENPILEELREDDDRSAQSAEASNETEIIESSESLTSTIEVSSSTEANSSTDWEGYAESFTDYQGVAAHKGQGSGEDRPDYEGSTSSEENLIEHLISQIRFSDIDQELKQIAFFIVGNLDNNGYLSSPKDELCQQVGCAPEQFAKALEFIRSLDPAGVGASDLKDCLLLQLEFLGLSNSLAAKIVDQHLDKLEKRKLDQIAKIEKITIEDVKAAVEQIRKLEPFPARNFSEETARYVTPDVYVQKVQGDYVVTLNDEGLPKLRINPMYLAMLKKEAAEAGGIKDYLQDRIKAAAWLIKSDLQRRQTIIKVAESIVKFQKPFLDHGISRLRPLVLKDVADDIGMHESTVSRVTSNKYMHTSQGVYELKFFFSSGLKSSTGDVSASSIKERIKSIISSEDALKPVSDQEIVEILTKENVQIARRTVAKYRETLGIEPSSQRKRAF